MDHFNPDNQPINFRNWRETYPLDEGMKKWCHTVQGVERWHRAHRCYWFHRGRLSQWSSRWTGILTRKKMDFSGSGLLLMCTFHWIARNFHCIPVLVSPHHVVDHFADGDLHRSQGFLGWQYVSQAGEAQHAGHSKQHLCDQLWILLSPLLTACRGRW